MICNSLEPEGGAGGGFEDTHWSMVLAASHEDSPVAEAALSRLCQAYWYPLFVFIRRRGYDPEVAKDLTQEFFARLLAKDFLRVADRQRGRFRTFLLSCVEHFLLNERKKEKTLKRGGAFQIVSLDAEDPEERYRSEPIEEMSPDKLMDRRWALTLLDLTLAQLQKEYAAVGKQNHFDVFQSCLSGSKEMLGTYAELGARLGLNEDAARQAGFRLRSRYGELLRRNVAQTVASPDDLRAELDHLRAALS